MEVRKTIPKCELPCEVFSYCTKGKPYLYRIDDDNEFELTNKLRFEEDWTADWTVKDYNAQNGKVVASFVLNEFDTIETNNFENWLQGNMYNVSDKQLKDMQLNQEELWGYGGGKTLYGWHIDDLVIYDKPKELSEFGIKRAPQSWVYCEKVEG